MASEVGKKNSVMKSDSLDEAKENMKKDKKERKKKSIEEVKNKAEILENDKLYSRSGKTKIYPEVSKKAEKKEKHSSSSFYFDRNIEKSVGVKLKESSEKKATKLYFKKDAADIGLAEHKAVMDRKEISYDCEDQKEALKKAQQKAEQIKYAEKRLVSDIKVKKIIKETERRIINHIKSSKVGIIITVLFLLVFAVFFTLITSFCSSFADNGAMYLATSFISEKSDIYASNNHLTNRENELINYINHIPDYYVGWNEYNYDIDYIGHDPYQLIAYLSALEIEFQYDGKIQNMINEIYDSMYHLETESIHEVRSYTEIETDSDGNETEVTVSYDYNILNVRLKRKSFDEVVYQKLNDEGVYDLYLAMVENKGNDPELF